MLVVRPARPDDIDALFDLIQLSEYGLSTLKISKAKLEERVQESAAAFGQPSAKPHGQPYVFVMEDLARGRIVGTSAIYAKVGGFEPFYMYEIKTEVKHSKGLGIHKEIQYLSLCKEYDGPTEIGSLFLSPDYWGSGHGRLLSMARFLFIAEFRQRFESETTAELRGIVHQDGHSPLWDALGAHFFQIEYPKAETLTFESKKFIAELMPHHPIYIPLLPKEAQDVIGQVHRNTRPAMAMLEKEGFQYRGFVDIFDGGPAVHCSTDQIRAVRESRGGTVAAVAAQVDGPTLLIANSRLKFRATLGNLRWESEQGAVIDEVTALRLKLKVGDKLRAVPLRPSDSTQLAQANRGAENSGGT